MEEYVWTDSVSINSASSAIILAYREAGQRQIACVFLSGLSIITGPGTLASFKPYLSIPSSS